MLHFILGRSGFGKTEYVFSDIEKRVSDSEEGIVLLLPEQFSFISESRLLRSLGEKNMAKVDCLSFSRLSNEIKRLYGGEILPTISKGGKSILMKRAIDSVSDSFSLFGKNINSLTFVSSMIQIYDEMKSCNLTSDLILNLGENIDNVLLQKKLFDISLVMNSYESLLGGCYFDPANELSLVYNILINTDYFDGKTVYIDGFSGFVAQEYKILEIIIAKAKDVYITLCADEKKDPYSVFAYVNDTAAILKRIADKADCEYENVILYKNMRTKNQDLLAVEKSLFCGTAAYDTEPDNIRIYSAKSIRDMCRDTALQIKCLLRDGYKAKEIVVVTRELDTYSSELVSAFKKYEVPFFMDERQPIKTQPIIIFVSYLLRIVNQSFRSDDILSLAKTGLTELNDSEISLLENYVFMWNINGSKWKKDFNNSTEGFVSDISDKDAEKLKIINNARKKLVEPIIIFSNAAKKKSAKDICRAVYFTLKEFRADYYLTQSAIALEKEGKSVIALEQGKVWDLLMQILDQMAGTLGDSEISLKEFASLFSLIIDSEDFGEIPAGLDNIQLGQADRIRMDNPRAVFILGANEGEFPKAVNSSGLLSERERKILAQNDFKLYSFGEIINVQESYFAYMACSAPKDKLFVSYLGNTGREAAPSAIVSGLFEMFPLLAEIKLEDLNGLEIIDSRASAFELMASEYYNSDSFYASLKKFFEKDEHFIAVKNLAENEEPQIDDTDISKSLFGYNMFVSASRVEDFYNCRFRYFCKFGLGAKPRKRAEINPMQRGTLIHYVLEDIISSRGSKKLSALSHDEIKVMVEKSIQEYYVTYMGDIGDMGERFLYNFKRLSNMIYSVVFRLAEEFRHCDFEAKAFELPIDIDGAIKPQTIILDDGGSMKIKGSIDRVDLLVRDGKQYVRVVDYKSGSKKFLLNDVLHGLNLQMLIYLFNLCNDKACSFSGIPAGILYMHASRPLISIESRQYSENSIEKSEQKAFKMNGLILNDDSHNVASAMEHDLEGRYIPVHLDKKGSIVGSIASLSELGKLQNKINELISKMGQDLHNGRIAQNPVKSKSHDTTCEYCDFTSICSMKKHISNRTFEELSDAQARELLREGEIF